MAPPKTRPDPDDLPDQGSDLPGNDRFGPDSLPTKEGPDLPGIDPFQPDMEPQPI